MDQKPFSIPTVYDGEELFEGAEAELTSGKGDDE